MNNFLFNFDSYKCSHESMYPHGLTSLYSYLESRNPSNFSSETLFFGLQAILRKLSGEVLTAAKVKDFARFAEYHFGSTEVFSEAKWQRLVEKHQGRLPVRIKAVPEGTLVQHGNVLMTIENTDPEFAWLTNILETQLMHVWYPITVASLSFGIKKACHRFLSETCDDDRVDGHLAFMLHDFGYRGVSSLESAGIGDAAHLLNFSGTDTLAAFPFLRENYPFSESSEWNTWKNNCPAYSVAATEHSVMTMLGQENEVQTIRNCMNAYPSGILAMVADSYNTLGFIDILGTEFHDQIVNRKGRIVVRLDSGDPVTSVITALYRIASHFPPTINSKGYKVLPDYIRVLQGDGVNYESIQDILAAMQREGWAAENIVFGMGGKLLQYLNRDMFGFAIKASHCVINGVGRDVFKNPATQSSKRSKKGRLALVMEAEGFRTVPEAQANGGDHLRTVFENGIVFNKESFETVRERAALWFNAVARQPQLGVGH